MKKSLLVLFLILISQVQAQVGIGTTNPQAALDIAATDSGILIPRVALTDRLDTTTVTNPAGGELAIGTLAYNTQNSTGSNFISEGFVFWDGSRWQRLVPRTEVMLRRFRDTAPPLDDSITGIGGLGFVFNFAVESFNNIVGSSFDESTQKLILPTGLYELRANIRVSGNQNFAYTIDYFPRITASGMFENEIAASIRGSAAPPNFNSDTSGSELLAIFEVTDATAEIDFEIGFIANSMGGPIISDQSYLLVKRLN